MVVEEMPVAAERWGVEERVVASAEDWGVEEMGWEVEAMVLAVEEMVVVGAKGWGVEEMEWEVEVMVLAVEDMVAGKDMAAVGRAMVGAHMEARVVEAARMEGLHSLESGEAG